MHPSSRDTTLCALLAFAAILLVPDLALAQSVDLCPMVANMWTSGVAPTVATLGVIALGVGATFGKVSWGMAVMVAVGIAVMFSAGAMVASVPNGRGC